MKKVLLFLLVIAALMVIYKIRPSFSPVSKERAAQIVSQLPEVAAFTQQLLQQNKRPSIDVTDDYASPGKFWSVHVYEALEDHTATFGWYSVDKKTGTVQKVL